MDIKTICLGVLSLGDASGYEIKKLFEDGPFSHFYHAGFGSIYPALNDLLANGKVTCTEIEQDGRPAKKVYAITDAGSADLCEALHTQPGRDRIRSEALVTMYFGHMLEAAQKHEVFGTYDRTYRDALDGLRSLDISGRTKEQKFVHGLGVAIYEAAVGYLERERNQFLDGVGEEAENDDEPQLATGGLK